MLLKVENAIISVSDKTGLKPLAERLHQSGVHIYSTGGTARSIEELGVPVTKISDYTGFPEILDGRVKSLHPRIHGGIEPGNVRLGAIVRHHYNRWNGKHESTD